jgi:DNA-binding SARP family transcriptional activator
VLLLGRVALTGADGCEIPVSGAQRRGVLAVLALDLGRVVPLTRVCELLWGEQPPPRAKAAVQGHVAALRKVLTGTGVRIDTRVPGYLMQGPAEAVDAAQFRTLLHCAPDDGRRLAQALNLWRGSALAGLPATDLHRVLAAELEELRTQTLERWVRVQLAASNAEAALPALEAAVRADPLRESLTALLIRCLHQCGRTGEALAAYEHTKERLADELGIDPGPHLQHALADLSARHAVWAPTANGIRVGPGLRAQPQVAPVRSSLAIPRLLPPPVPGFVGRTAETAFLERACAPQRTGPVRVVITGAAGVGKTATVVNWAHSAAARFQDGLLFADMCGFGPGGPLDPSDVLAGFLRALGLPASALPDREGLAALYQDTIRDLRLLVVLDNADTAQRVRPLMAQGRYCATVVTSRSTLEELHLVDGVAVLPLPSLAASEAASLLARTAGEARVRAEPRAAEKITEFCGRLPLALLLCGARLAVRPSWRLEESAQELADERSRLAALDVDGSRRLLDTLHLSRRHLAPDASRLLALLGLHPGAVVDAPAAAALLGLDAATARRALGNLAAYHLTDEAAPGLHSRHDLIRAYCARLADDEISPQERRIALDRLLRYYVEAVGRAREWVEGGYESGPASTRPTQAAREVKRTQVWFRRTEPTLRALADEAIEQGFVEYAICLAWDSASLYSTTGNLYEWEQMSALGVRAARAEGSPLSRARMYHSHACALSTRDRARDAVVWHERAMRAADESGDATTRSMVLTAFGGSLVKLGRARDSVPVLEELLSLSEGLADAARRVAQTLTHLAAAWLSLNEPERALGYVERALDTLEQLPRHADRAFTAQVHARVLRALGRLDEALGAALRALAISREWESATLEADAADLLGGLLHELGHDGEAAAHLRLAARLYERQGRAAAGVRARLCAAESPANGDYADIGASGGGSADDGYAAAAVR